MTWRERLARIDAFQKGRTFRIIASIVLILAIAGAGIAYFVATNQPVEGPGVAMPEAMPEATQEQRDAVEATRRVIQAVLAGREDSTSVGVGLAAAAAMGLAVIWLGLGLTYIALIVLGLVPSLILYGMGMHTPAWLLGGVVVLTASFSAFMRAMRVALGGPSRTMAVAKNVLDEATRLKISQVFIVVLIVGLALLPLTIGASEQLRYRVQTFLSFSMGGSFWLIATLIVLFSVATVSFEQRDRVIWQTMTKPVAPWQYILGKWLGVSSLAAILLAVTGAGVFLFTEHLRSQRADREVAPYVTEDGSLSRDRHILETQILSARKTRLPTEPALDREALAKTVEQVAKADIDRTGDQLTGGEKAMFEGSREARYAAIEKAIIDEYRLQWRSIEPGTAEEFRFEGLGAARKSNQLVLLRYKIDTGNNSPNEQYKIAFQFRGEEPRAKDVVLGQTLIIELLPTAIDEDGTLAVAIFNGDPIQRIINPKTFTFAPDGLEVSYAASSFPANFARVMFVLWVKLAFLAMLGVFAATFLSFPVACLVAFGAFLAAEGSPFLRSSLDSFATASTDGKEIYYIRSVMAAISMAVSWVFSTYGNLNPTNRVTEGVLMSWREVLEGLLVLTAWIGVLFTAAVAIFRKRELATYSGH